MSGRIGLPERDSSAWQQSPGCDLQTKNSGI